MCQSIALLLTVLISCDASVQLFRNARTRVTQVTQLSNGSDYVSIQMCGWDGYPPCFLTIGSRDCRSSGGKLQTVNTEGRCLELYMNKYCLSDAFFVNSITPINVRFVIVYNL